MDNAAAAAADSAASSAVRSASRSAACAAACSSIYISFGSPFTSVRRVRPANANGPVCWGACGILRRSRHTHSGGRWSATQPLAFCPLSDAQPAAKPSEARGHRGAEQDAEPDPAAEPEQATEPEQAAEPEKAGHRSPVAFRALPAAEPLPAPAQRVFGATRRPEIAGPDPRRQMRCRGCRRSRRRGGFAGHAGFDAGGRVAPCADLLAPRAP